MILRGGYRRLGGVGGGGILGHGFERGAALGAVTFLFTDIEGSTARWEADAEAMRNALVEHDELLGREIESHSGWMFKHAGDGMCAAFSTPAAAVEAAIAAQQVLRFPVRMGIATGEAEPRADDYFGPVLNRVARVMAAGRLLIQCDGQRFTAPNGQPRVAFEIVLQWVRESSTQRGSDRQRSTKWRCVASRNPGPASAAVASCSHRSNSPEWNALHACHAR